MLINQLTNISNVIQAEIDNGYIAGAAIRVIHNNGICFDQAYGREDLENDIPMPKNAIYRMHSMTKPITSVAAMILFERGELNLLSPVSDYLKGFVNQKVYRDNGLIDVKKQVTIQDLLNMTSGILYPEGSVPGQLMGALYDEVVAAHHGGHPVGTLEFCNRMGQIPLAYQPGESWGYGASADVLGAVIEEISGMKYSRFLEEEIFGPLDMKDTAFYVSQEKRSRFAKIYDYNPEKKKLMLYTGDFLALFDYMDPPAFESGGAGLVSTIEDYSHFAKMLVDKGIYKDFRILGRKTVEYIAVPQLKGEQLTAYNWDSLIGYNYGNLCRILMDPVKAATNGTAGEFGWDGWCGNYFFIDPKEKLIMIYMVQRCGGSGPDYMRKLRNIVYGAL
jgi:CubicO group peptidase (beta-lactamase class C family)